MEEDAKDPSLSSRPYSPQRCPYCLLTIDSMDESKAHQEEYINTWKPPGIEIYRQDQLSFYLLDGTEDLLHRLVSVGKAFLLGKFIVEDLDKYEFVMMTKSEEDGSTAHPGLLLEKEGE